MWMDFITETKCFKCWMKLFIKYPSDYVLKEVRSSRVWHLVLSKMDTNVSEESHLPVIRLNRGWKEQVNPKCRMSHQEREAGFYFYFFKILRMWHLKAWIYVYMCVYIYIYIWKKSFSLYITIPMILQVAGIVYLGAGISATLPMMRSCRPYYATRKFDFWYQW
jgi:hypothetical protein